MRLVPCFDEVIEFPNLTNKIAVSNVLDSCFSLSLLEHFHSWLADELLRLIVTICETLEKIVNSQKLNDPLGMCYMRIRKKPHFHLGLVNVLQKRSQLRIRAQDVVQWESIVNLAVKLQGIYLVVFDQALNRKPIVLIVLVVQHERILRGERQVLYEELVDEILHEIMDFLAPWVEAIVDVEKEDRPAVGGCICRKHV